MKKHEAELKSILATVFDIDPERIDDSSSPDNIKEWDSLKHMMLVLALEENFSITLTDEQAVQIISYPLIKNILLEHNIEIV